MRTVFVTLRALFTWMKFGAAPFMPLCNPLGMCFRTSGFPLNVRRRSVRFIAIAHNVVLAMTSASLARFAMASGIIDVLCWGVTLVGQGIFDP